MSHILEVQAIDQPHFIIGEEMDSSLEPNRRIVCMKFFTRKEIFDRELWIHSRLKGNTETKESLDASQAVDIHVLPLIASYSAKSDPRYRNDIQSFLTLVSTKSVDIIPLTSSTLMWTLAPPILDNIGFFTKSRHSATFALQQYQYCLVFEQGDYTLQDALQQGMVASWSWLEVRHYLYDLAQALLSLHQHGVIHGSLTPSKVMLSLPQETLPSNDDPNLQPLTACMTKSLVKLTDFSGSRLLHSTKISEDSETKRDNVLDKLTHPLFDVCDDSFLAITEASHIALLPPECFAKLKTFSEIEKYCQYFDLSIDRKGVVRHTVNHSVWRQQVTERLQRLMRFSDHGIEVLKSFRSDRLHQDDESPVESLPYSLYQPNVAIDIWAFGKICEEIVSQLDLNGTPLLMQSLLKFVLNRDPQRRPQTMLEILKHDFFSLSDESFVEHDDYIQDSESLVKVESTPQLNTSYAMILNTIVEKEVGIKEYLVSSGIRSTLMKLKFEEKEISPQIAISLMRDILPMLYPMVAWSSLLPTLSQGEDKASILDWHSFKSEVLSLLRHYCMSDNYSAQEQASSLMGFNVDSDRNEEVHTHDDDDDDDVLGSEATSVTGFDEISTQHDREKRKALRNSMLLPEERLETADGMVMGSRHEDMIDQGKRSIRENENQQKDKQKQLDSGGDCRSEQESEVSSVQEENEMYSEKQWVTGKNILQLLDSIDMSLQSVRRSGVVNISIEALNALLDTKQSWLEEKKKIREIEGQLCVKRDHQQPNGIIDESAFKVGDNYDDEDEHWFHEHENGDYGEATEVPVDVNCIKTTVEQCVLC
jgi:serine/threonine protein kinase